MSNQIQLRECASYSYCARSWRQQTNPWRKKWSILSPISRHNRKSFWTPVNSDRFGVSDIFNESSDCFKFKDCKLQFYEKRRLFSYFSVNPRTPASRWRRLLILKPKKINSFKIIIGFFFTPPLFLATKVAISFVNYSPKIIICTQKPKIEKKFTAIDQSSERAPFSTAYLQLALAHARNSRVKKGMYKIKGKECFLGLQIIH